MKKSLLQNVILTVACLLITSSLHSQAPQGIPYQALIRDNAGAPLMNAAVTVRFTLHQNEVTGAVEYQETQILTTNAYGLVNTQFGQGTPTQGSFAGIIWSNTSKFIQVEANDGSGYVDMGTQQMMSVPYAMYSATAAAANTSVTAENGISNVSQTGDTLYMSNGNFIIVPGISAANYPPAVLGCTDNAACNYSSAATQNDNSCLYTGAICDDGNANTTNDVINGSCVCAGTPPSGSGTGAQLLPGNATCAAQNISVTGCGGQTSLTYDGRTYDLVEIGGQCWFADNLATDQYRNGDLISTGLSNTTWQNTTSGAFAIYNNDPANDATYGKLYNWYTTVDSRGLCPTGWHVPTDCEWMYLESSLGMSVTDQETDGIRGTNEGGALKAITGWNSPNTGATNSSGFKALPGSHRWINGAYNLIGTNGYWWSCTEHDSNSSWYRELRNDVSHIDRTSDHKKDGFSIRCVRD